MELESKQWQCEFCTFMNKSTWLVCGMCLKESEQSNADDDQLDSFYTDFLDELELKVAPEIAHSAVAAVSAATAVTTVASKPIAQPFAAATAANTHYSSVFPVAQPPDYSNFAASRTIPGLVANSYTSCAAAYPVNAECVQYTRPISAVISKNITPVPIPSSKAVKYYPYNIVPVTTNGTYTNDDRLTTTSRVVRITVPVTTSSQRVNVITPGCAATSRLRVINPRCNPSYFKPDLATVTSTAASVPTVNVVNPFDNFPASTYAHARIGDPATVTSTAASVPTVKVVNPFDDFLSSTYAPASINVVQPPTYNDAFYAITSATSLVSPIANPTFTFSNNIGAMAQPPRYRNVSFASTSILSDSTFKLNFAPQSSPTENSITFSTRSTSATFGAACTSNLPVASFGAISPDSTYNYGLNNAPFNPATVVAQCDLTSAPLSFLNNNSCASTSNAPVARCITATPTLNGAARVTTAHFATCSNTGWTCTYCTFTNDNLLLRCAICDTRKSKNQPVVQPLPVVSTGTTRKEAYSAKDQDAHFKCPLCYLSFAQAEGISLQLCGHKFCKNCLKDVINYSEEIRLQCPRKIKGVLCNSLMTVQEIGLILNLEYSGNDARPNISPDANVIDLCTDDNDDDSQAKCSTPADASGITARTQPKSGKEINYQELLDLEKEILITNIEPFDCTICMTEQERGEGVIIRDCLHTFCKECLKQAIKCNTDAVMQCLYGDGTTRCESVLQDREIRALVDADVFEEHLKRSITEAENKTHNAFHCKTVDCVGWCEYEDDVSEFTCPVCSRINCINCKAIHTGLNCKQYQLKLQLNSANNPDDAKTNEMLQNMLKRGTAMHCPKCAIILSKVAGCDWLCCSMCKTEICWVTRGPRWGPKGRGDNTGGCRCRYNGVPCHPKCGNCH